ncbi:MAG: nucleotidyltransferase family protein [Verrucomicrobiota bacterium]
MKPLVNSDAPATWENPYGYWPKETHWDLLQAIYLDDNQDALGRWREHCEIDTADAGMLRLLPLLYRRVKADGIDIPEFTRLKSKYRYTVYRNNLTIHRLNGVVRALSDAQIPVILVKGVSLLVNYYRDIGLRPMNDWDISVPFDEYNRTCEILEARNFRPQIKVTESYRHVRSSQGWEDEDSFEIDLHWRCLPGHIRKDLPMVWNSVRKVSFRDLSVSTPSPEIDLAMVLIHGLEPNPTPPIRWVADAIEILDSTDNINWQLFESLCPRDNFRQKLGPAFRFLKALRPEIDLPYAEEYPGELNELADEFTPLKRNSGILPYMKASLSTYCSTSARDPISIRIQNIPHYLRYHFSIEDHESLFDNLTSRLRRRLQIAKSTT